MQAFRGCNPSVYNSIHIVVSTVYIGAVPPWLQDDPVKGNSAVGPSLQDFLKHSKKRLTEVCFQKSFWKTVASRRVSVRLCVLCFQKSRRSSGSFLPTESGPTLTTALRPAQTGCHRLAVCGTMGGDGNPGEIHCTPRISIWWNVYNRMSNRYI